MKKMTGLILKIFLGLFLVILLLAFAVPIIFKGKIREKVVQVINGSVNAKVSFGDYKLGFFRNFPNLTFSLDDVSVTGIDKFENDTLTSFKTLNLVFNLSSLFKKTGYEVKSVVINDATVNALVLEDGSANWDIMKEPTENETPEESSAGMKIQLKNIEILNSSISYIDRSSSIETWLNKMNFNIKGDMTSSEADLEILANSAEVTFIMEGMKYLNKATADARINVAANLDSMVFNLRDNYLRINDLGLNFAGMVAMPGEDIKTDLTFKSEQTSFKSLLSVIPAVYMADFKDLKTTGEFNLSGSAKGVYSDADSTMPDISLDLSVSNGMISYPALPEQIKNIAIKSKVFVDGKDMDKTTVNVDKFHMELAGNPFDMSFDLKTPVSDPDFKGSMAGRIDFTALARAIPMDSLNISGLMEVSLSMAGRMSMIEKEQYDKFKAAGNMDISNMLVSMTGYPDVKINTAGFNFTPAYAALENADLNVGGRSDFSLSGRLENYIPYVFKNETIRGNLSLHSKVVDLGEIMSKIVTDTTEINDTTSLAVIKIPENIDFDFNALIDKFVYDKIKVSNLKGHIIVKNGILSMKETGMNLLGGSILMNADYDTRDTLKPLVRMDLGIQNLGVNDAFTTFNTIQQLAPTSKGITGKVNLNLSYSSLLGRNFMPLIQTISGGGKLQSNEITLVESAIFNKMKETLKLGSNYSNTFKDLNVSFKVKDGRIFVSPFNTKVGNLKMNISGDQGIDQTINYIIKTELPRSDLGSSVNSLIDNLSAQAARFGIVYKPADLIKVNVKVSGTFLKPVVAPFFGNAPSDSAGGVKATAKESVKQVIDNTVDKTKEKARSEAEVQAEKIMKEAEEKGQLLRDEAAKAAEKIRQEADLQGQKLVKEAETKGPVAKLAAQKTAGSLKKEADKRAVQVVQEADNKANTLLKEAQTKRDDLLNKIN